MTSKDIHKALINRFPYMKIGVGYGASGGFVAWGREKPEGNRIEFGPDPDVDALISKMI